MIRDNGINYIESLSSIEQNNIFNNKYRGNTPQVLYANGGSWNKLSMRERYNYIHNNYDILANGGTLDDIKRRFAEGGDVSSDDLMTAKIDVLTPKNFSYPYREKLRDYSFKDRRESDNVLDFRGVGQKPNEMLRELPLYMYYYFPSAKKQVLEALKGNFMPDYYEDVNDIPEQWKNDRMKRIDFLNDKYGLQGKDRMRYFAEGGPKEVLERVNSSNADFVQRLKDPNRETIQDWSNPNYVATHKPSVGTDEYGNNYIYPEVQNIDGKLVDFTRPPYATWIGRAAAEERGDTVRVNNLDDAIRFTETYKQYYPSFNYSSGGKIHIKPENRGKFTALKKRTGHSASWFKAHGTPAQRKMATFALNSRHWHKHAFGGYLEGEEYDLPEEEIKSLIDLGYEIEYI